MDVSSAAAASTAMSTAKLQQDVGIAVLSNVMDFAKQQNNQMIEMMAQSTHPHLGKNLDIKI
ncbi:YjfB family protein [Paenibacillus abyssi]|uniref:Motility protein n=1 Tax=Paenibacillus abyssi TaxID=1340531 RepID=A0A917FW98_9BACL|nr:YjfB family protein [Paenibacillus abyssi]GGG06753.1 hypothetical protein GCM10010916_24590 [Paenibacillus abyssi]